MNGSEKVGLSTCCSHSKPCNYTRTVALSGFTLLPFHFSTGHPLRPCPSHPFGCSGFLVPSTLHSRNTVPGSCLVIEGRCLFKSLYQGTRRLSQKYSRSSRIGSGGRPASFGHSPLSSRIACRVCFCSPIRDSERGFVLRVWNTRG